MIDKLLQARRPEDVFGELHEGDRGKREARLIYSDLAKQVHPDVNHDPGALEAFKCLSKLYTAANKALDAGTYGQGVTIVDPVVIQSKRHAYKVTNTLAKGEVSNLFECMFDAVPGGMDEPALMKVARNANHNDLMANEAKVLKELLSDPETYDLVSPYLPRFVETFGYRVGREKARQATVFTPMPDEKGGYLGLVSLADVREVYPDGIDPKDMAWMLRRLFIGLGMIHGQGYCHNAITPEHVLIQPEQHGLVIVDWKNACKEGTKPYGFVKSRKDFYPAAYFAEKKARPEHDIFMAVECMKFVVGRALKLPGRMRAFFNGCQRGTLPSAIDLKEEFDALIEDLWGPKKFRPFSMVK